MYYLCEGERGIGLKQEKNVATRLERYGRPAKEYKKEKVTKIELGKHRIVHIHLGALAGRAGIEA